MPRLDLYSLGSVTTQVALTDQPVRIGRALSCELCIKDPKVSRMHAEIRREEGGLVLVNHSPRGTRLNSQLVQERHPLAPGDRLFFGEAFTVVVEKDDPVGESSTLEPGLAEVRYQTLFARMTEAFALFEVVPGEEGRLADYRFLQANHAFEELTGLKSDELIWRSALEALPHQDSLWKETLEQVALTEEAVEVERLSPSLGKHLWIRAFRPARGQVALLLHDISKRKLAEEALRREHQLSEQVIRCAREGVIVYGPDLRYLIWNPYMEQLSGLPAKEVLGRLPLEVFPNLQGTGAIERLQRALAGETVDAAEFPLHFPSQGRTAWASQSCAPLHDGAGAIIGVIATVADITERIRLQEEHQRYEAQVRRTDKMESLGLLAGGVAHDMNNVLASILALASIHQRHSSDLASLREDMETIVKACQRGGALVKGLLGFARDNLPEERELDLNTVVREGVALLERTTLQRVKLDLDLTEGLRPVKGDPAALTHALMNLCVNAVDAMPGGGTLTLRTRNEDAGSVRLEVADTGHGMSKEVLDKALVPFFTTKPQGKGTGLGLPIVFGTVKAHRGTMEIQSTLGVGTRMSLRFPACTPKVPAKPPAQRRAAPSSNALHVLWSTTTS